MLLPTDGEEPQALVTTTSIRARRRLPQLFSPEAVWVLGIGGSLSLETAQGIEHLTDSPPERVRSPHPHVEADCCLEQARVAVSKRSGSATAPETSCRW